MHGGNERIVEEEKPVIKNTRRKHSDGREGSFRHTHFEPDGNSRLLNTEDFRTSEQDSRSENRDFRTTNLDRKMDNDSNQTEESFRRRNDLERSGKLDNDSKQIEGSFRRNDIERTGKSDEDFRINTERRSDSRRLERDGEVDYGYPPRSMMVGQTEQDSMEVDNLCNKLLDDLQAKRSTHPADLDPDLRAPDPAVSGVAVEALVERRVEDKGEGGEEVVEQRVLRVHSFGEVRQT